MQVRYLVMPSTSYSHIDHALFSSPGDLKRVVDYVEYLTVECSPGFVDETNNQSSGIHDFFVPPYILSGAAMPSKPRAVTSRSRTSDVKRSRKARFSASSSERMWCLW